MRFRRCWKRAELEAQGVDVSVCAESEPLLALRDVGHLTACHFAETAAVI
jgi:hypothetical protein